MRSSFAAFIVVLSLFAFYGQALAQEKTEESPRKGIFDYFNGAGKYILGDSEGDVHRPYLKDAKTPQNNQLDQDGWTPDDWAQDKGSVTAVIDGLYDAGILVDQYEDKVPVLEVGKPFLMLSPMDQERVVAFVDYAFQITSPPKPGVFSIVIEQKSGMRLLGLYSIHGLQLQ